ncbi:type IX secretion system plug protein domain-containing protein [Fodinibius sp. N2]|uniref:type IX secretion system plug protein n=1 Tax=Fodinibius alkaliphilus TaxID=3140241 RepID=UPI003159A056
MFLKDHICNKISILIILGIILGGCAPSNTSQNHKKTSQTKPLEGAFSLPQQKASPNDIQSIQLHPKGQPGQAPIIRLNSKQQLELSFDYLGSQNRQFRVTVVHYDQDWQQSSIGPNTYLDSFSETTITSSQASFGQRPSYHHVQFSFPNNELRPAVSGNFLLEVRSTDDNTLLFSMPFFVTEDEGAIKTEIKQQFTQRRDGRPLNQLFSTYRYPGFVEYPQFDLGMSFAHNQFWGQTKIVKSLDTITPGELRGYIEDENAFIGNYEFKHLNLQDFTADGRQIIEYQPDTIPPKITLRRDVQNLDFNPRFERSDLFQKGPSDGHNNQYAQVKFQLETVDSIPHSSDIYVVGDFNNWILNEQNKMDYDNTEQLWKGNALIKQGSYAYKYVIVDNNRIDDLNLDQGFLSSRQIYFTFIYFNDPDRHFDRLLKVDRIIK